MAEGIVIIAAVFVTVGLGGLGGLYWYLRRGDRAFEQTLRDRYR